MELTGKCKEQFDKWYCIEFEKRSLPYTQGFYVSDLSIQYGVYVDFFDSVGIDLDLFKSRVNKKIFYVCIDDFSSQPFNSRPKARTAAIEKANEIYNT
tara:strand:- start:232 stop:525 length:294 start_codon:yes stop_codon:yes gene_type:complete